MSDGIAPIVSRAMAYTFREKPNDPVEFFARFLLNEILIKDQARIVSFTASQISCLGRST